MQNKKPAQNSYNGWKPKMTRSVILVCSNCKTKYIKTRTEQATCVRCMFIIKK